MKITSVKFREQIAKLVIQKSEIEKAISELTKLCDEVDAAIDGKQSNIKITEILSEV